MDMKQLYVKKVNVVEYIIIELFIYTITVADLEEGPRGPGSHPYAKHFRASTLYIL